MRALALIGAAADILIAIFLAIVFGYVLDSWHDPHAWAGPIVTSVWAVAFALSAGAPILAYVLHRRATPAGRVALVAWAPALLLTAITVVGFILSPP